MHNQTKVCACFDMHSRTCAEKQPQAFHDLQVDATFEDAENLQAMPRLVYALLRSPLLGLHPDLHPDTPTALRLLWSSLPPEDLQTAVYPCLSSFQDPDTQVTHICVACEKRQNTSCICSETP